MLAYYITAHGYGHGVRSCDILNALRTLHPAMQIDVFSDLPPSFFESRLPGNSIRLHPGSFDVGLKQLDSIRVDLEASVGQVTDLCARWAHLVDEVAGQVRSSGGRCVVADIPAIPLQGAALAGAHAVAVGNFGWDWIYADLASRDPRWDAASHRFAEGYRSAELLLRLPFHEPMRAFREIEDIPVVAAAGRERRREIAALQKCDPGRTWVLLSFTTLGWSAEALRRVQELRDYEFFTVRPLAWDGTRIHAIDRRQISFTDLVASVDCVVSKPGFGIVSDCVVNGTPLIYAERSDFREYGVLEAAITRYLKSLHIPAAKLYSGDLEDALEAIGRQPEPVEKAPLGGAAIAARRIADLLD